MTVRQKRKDRAHWEIGVPIFISLMIGILDNVSQPNPSRYQSFLVFLTSLTGSFCVSILLHLHTIRREFLEAFESYKAFRLDNEIGECIGEIAKSIESVQAHNWPPYATAILRSRLKKLVLFIHKLESGKLVLPYAEAIEHTSKFFENAKGHIFATHCDSWSYWDRGSGTTQLTANAVAIKRHRKVTRVFIIGSTDDFDGLSDQQVASIVQEQIDKKIEVWAVPKSEIHKRYHRDIGVFYKDKEGVEIEFVAEWKSMSTKGHENRVGVLHFDESEFQQFRRMKHYLLHEKSIRIKDTKDWTEFRSRAGL